MPIVKEKDLVNPGFDEDKAERERLERKAEVREKDEATGIKSKFVSSILGLLKEYIQTAEHKDGPTCWINYKNQEETIADFAVFLKVMKDT